MPKIFQAKVIYQIMSSRYNKDIPLDVHEWMCPDIEPTAFNRWYMSHPIKSDILYQYPILRRFSEGLVPWAPSDDVSLDSIDEMVEKIDVNDRPQQFRKGVINEDTGKN